MDLERLKEKRKILRMSFTKHLTKIEFTLSKEFSVEFNKEAKLEELLSLKSQLTEKLNELIKVDENIQLQIKISEMEADISSCEEYKDRDLDAQEKRNEEKVIDDFISIMDSLIKEFSARFSQFKELSETFKFIMYPDVISFDKLNLSQFDWLEIEELEMQLIDFQSSSIWIQKFIETRKKLELIEAERLTSNISKNTSNEILETWNSIPDAFNCLKKLAYAILTIFSSTYACESLFSEINNIKDSLRNRLTDDSNSACILLKVTSYNPDISYFSSNLQQQKSH
ncbi:general transcription factor II-I repeat domain-containing protein 2A [Trichonephila clavipes]|nr:general transcription factor II-I repeat domain-containing protein 2A [Trichonephila clavipes]